MISRSSSSFASPASIVGKCMLGVCALFFSFSAVNAADCNESVGNPDIIIAVASNMWEPANTLAEDFNVLTGYSVQVCHGSTGSLVNEINAGSDYSLFLAANEIAPKQITVLTDGDDFNYTTGIPALWTQNEDLIDQSNGLIEVDALAVGINYVVIADPTVAPYGAAAVDIMENETRQWSEITPYLLTPYQQNIEDTYRYIRGDTNSIGYVALSQICQDGNITEGFGYKDYPSDYNIPQAGVQIDQGSASNAIAAVFVGYLLSPKGQDTLMNEYCYGARP